MGFAVNNAKVVCLVLAGYSHGCVLAHQMGHQLYKERKGKDRQNDPNHSP